MRAAQKDLVEKQSCEGLVEQRQEGIRDVLRGLDVLQRKVDTLQGQITRSGGGSRGAVSCR